MKPAAFEYLRPSSLEEAIALLQQYGDEAKLLSGGQSLIPVLNMRLARPQYLIDLGGLRDLSYIREQDAGIAIGALTRHRQVERSELVGALCPLLTEAVQNVAHPQIRNRGTIGGSVAHADPAAEISCAISCLGGTIKLTGPDGERTATPDEFFLTYMTTTIDPCEIVTEVWVPSLPDRTGWCFTELARRHGDFALVGVAATLTLGADGRIEGSSIALTGVGGVPYKAPELLAGEEPGAEAFARAAQEVERGVEPDGDLHASADYRRHLAGVLTQRALVTAYERAKGGAR